jgi:D-glycero-D-manno-heptose 1,7-bisphosphate phosphatase
MKLSPALFLDRDGIINVDHGYVHKTEDFQFVDGIFDIARAALAMNYLLVVITNQAGIGRGYYSQNDFDILTKWMCNIFEAERARISSVYSSPFHPTHGLGLYKRDDFSRKPNPGMLLQAASDLCIDLSLSVFLGDQLTDMKAGEAAGVGQNLLYLNGRPNKDFESEDYACVASLKETLIYL